MAKALDCSTKCSSNIYYSGLDEFTYFTSSDINIKPTPIFLKSEFIQILCKTHIELIVFRPLLDSFTWYAQGYGIVPEELSESSKLKEIFSSHLNITQTTESPEGVIGLSESGNCFYQAVIDFDENTGVTNFIIHEIKVQQIKISDELSLLLDENGEAKPTTRAELVKFIHLASNNTDVFGIDETNSIYNILDNKFIWQLATGNIIRLSCGFSHNMILTDTGAVYGWGNGSRGQLGQEVIILSSNLPTRIEFFDDLPCTVSDIATGGWHTLALTSDGDVYTWGWNESNQLGHSSQRISQVQCIPYPVDLGSLSNPVVQIVAGSRHSAVLMKDGSVYSWGYNKYGQLGVGDTDSRKEPTLIDLTSSNKIHGHPPKKLICSRWGTFLIYNDST